MEASTSNITLRVLAAIVSYSFLETLVALLGLHNSVSNASTTNSLAWDGAQGAPA